MSLVCVPPRCTISKHRSLFRWLFHKQVFCVAFLGLMRAFFWSQIISNLLCYSSALGCSGDCIQGTLWLSVMCHLRSLTYTLLAAVLGSLLLDDSPCLPLFPFAALPRPSVLLASTRTDFLQLCKCVLSFEAIWNIEVLKEVLLVYLLKCLLVCFLWPKLNIIYLSLTFHAAWYCSVTIGCILFFSEN